MTDADEDRLRVHRPDRPAAVLGLTVGDLLMVPAFAKRPLRERSKVLVGRVSRGRCVVVADGETRS